MMSSKPWALALACACALYGADATAGSAETPHSGEPPRGAAYQSDAAGQKLTGVIAIELTDIDLVDSTATSARATLRLRHGGVLNTLFTQVENTHNCSDQDVPDVNDCVRWESNFEIEQIEEALLMQFTEGPGGILARFFPDECGFDGSLCSLVVTPKLIDESAEITEPTGGSMSLFLVADVVLAVK